MILAKPSLRIKVFLLGMVVLVATLNLMGQHSCLEVRQPYMEAYSRQKKVGDFQLGKDSLLMGFKAIARFEDPSCQRDLLKRLAVIEGKRFDFQGKASAYEKFAQAWEISPDYDPVQTGNGWRWAGDAAADAGDYKRALLNLKNAEKEYMKSVSLDPELLARTYTLMGQCHSRFGDLDRSLSYHAKSQTYRDNKRVENPQFSAVGYNNLALVNQELGRFRIALQNSQKAFGLANSPISKAIAHNGIGNAALAMDSLELAEKAFKASLAGFESISEVNPLFLAQGQKALGEYYAQIEDFTTAETYFRMAVETGSHPAINGREKAGLLLALAKCHELQGEYKVALHQANLALTSIFPDQAALDGSIDLSTAPPEPYLMDAWFTIGRNLLGLRKDMQDRQKTLLQAADAFSLGFLQGARIRRGLGPGVSRELIASYLHQNFEPALQVQLELEQLLPGAGHLKQAFAYCELSKSMLLADALAEGQVKGWLGIPQEWTRRQEELRGRWRYFVAKRNQTEMAESQQPLNDSIFSIDQALDALDSEIQQEFPRYHRYLNPFQLLSDFGNNFPEWIAARCMISYFEGEDKIYAFKLYQGQLSSTTIARNEEYKSHFSNFIQHIQTDPSRGFDPNKDYDSMAKSGFFMGEKLLKPLFGKGGIPDQLCIIPDGQLWQLPFEAIPFGEDADPSRLYAGLPYLVKKVTLNYAYSAGLLDEIGTLRQRDRGNVLAIAPGFQDAGILQERLTELQVRSEPVAPLLASLDEVNQIRELMGDPVTLLTDTNALESEFKALAPGYSILHLSTHGLMDTLNDWNSGFLFSANDKAEENGILYLWEILNLDLKADLAVLSACQTGRGREVKGEGVMSLNRALTYAGVPSVVMSLWSVPDRPTQIQMVAFYEGLDQGLGYAEALRAAKLKYLQEEGDFLTSHPYYWAGFVQIGPPGENSRSKNWVWIGIILLILIGSLSWVLIRKKNAQ